MCTAEKDVDELVEKGYLTPKLGRQVLKLSLEGGLTPEQVCDKHGFWSCDHNPSLDQELDSAVKSAAVWSMDPVKLQGLVMTALWGRFSPQVVRERISKEIDRRNNTHLCKLAIEDIQTLADDRIFDSLCKDDGH